ncbi:unnamed protein product [Sphacelaria rigidula]
MSAVCNKSRNASLHPSSSAATVSASSPLAPDGPDRMVTSLMPSFGRPAAASRGDADKCIADNNSGTPVTVSQTVAGAGASGWAVSTTTSGRAAGISRVLKKMWSSVYMHRASAIFSVGVNPDFAPGYLDVVKHPIDLTTIRDRLDYDTHYNSKSMLYDDLVLMCKNAMLYNRPDTAYYSAAQELLHFIESTMGGD